MSDKVSSLLKIFIKILQGVEPLELIWLYFAIVSFFAAFGFFCSVSCRGNPCGCPFGAGGHNARPYVGQSVHLVTTHWV